MYLYLTVRVATRPTDLEGGWHEKISLFYWAFLNLGSHNFLEIFCSATFCRKRSQFPLIFACAFAPSGCGARRARFRRDVRKGTLHDP